MRKGRRVGGKHRLGELPAVEGTLILKQGEELVLTKDPSPGEPAPRDAEGRALGPSCVSFSLPEVFRAVRAGHAIWFDDGKIGGVVAEASSDRLVVKITTAASAGGKLRGGRGVNLPDTDLPLPALSEKDKEDLETIVRHADMVGLSFVREPRDVRLLRAELARLGRPDMPIVLKIETKQAFEELPGLLLAAMRGGTSGVMIARGDLAVECGWERLAEVQEEILWMCEAAHMPVIWATQVLETLAKKGKPSRSEITDAAMAERAECVMLNKGPHIVHAVRVLEDILRRMEAHQCKKRSMLRALDLARGFGAAEASRER